MLNQHASAGRLKTAKRTSASISCCSSEDGFNVYQSTCFSRYDACPRSRGAYMRRRFLVVVGGAAIA